MKWLAVLAASVLLLVLAWLFVGQGDMASGGPLQLPAPSAGVDEVVSSAQQLLRYSPTSDNVHLGATLLFSLVHRLTIEQWGPVQEAAFRGWCAMRRTPGSYVHLEVVAEELMKRFARWGTPAQLEEMIGWSNRDDAFKSRVDESLEKVAEETVGPSGYASSRLALLVSAALASNDVLRARRFLIRASWGDVPADSRAEALRLERAIDLRLSAGSGETDFDSLFEVWPAAKESMSLRSLLEDVGVIAAMSGNDQRDYRKIEGAIMASKERADAREYWDRVLHGVAISTAQGVYIQEYALVALAKQIGDVFGPPDYATRFWEELAGRAKGEDLRVAMWRAECWRKALQATEHRTRRFVCLDKMMAEFIAANQATNGMRAFTQLRGLVESAETSTKLQALGDDLASREAADKARLAQMRERGKFAGVRTELTFLRENLQKIRASAGATSDEVAALEKRIKELEGQLPE